MKHISTEAQFRAIFPAVRVVELQWGEMDAFQHVNNVQYFRYFESARISLFEKTNLMNSMQTDGIGPILAETSCRYRLPLTYPDHILVGTGIDEITEFGFTQSYAIFSQSQQSITTTATSRVTMLNYRKNRKHTLTASEVTLLESLRIKQA